MIVLLNGTNYTSDTDGLDNFVITENYKGADGAADKQVSSPLIFKDAAYDFIYDELIIGECGRDKYIEVEIYDSCCGGIQFKGLIRGDAITWNSRRCLITARVIQENEITKAYRDIRNKLIYEGIESNPKPIVPALIKPTGGLFGLGVFTPFVRAHPVFYIRQYLENIANSAGLTLQCSIFNNVTSPYYDAVYLPPLIDRGLIPVPAPTEWVEDNAPIKNGAQFMDDLKLLFNVDWRVKDDVLIVERRDYFKASEAWVAYTALDNVSEIEFSFTGDKKPAYMDFSYSQDALEIDGNVGLGLSKGIYSDIVEWNDPPSILQENVFQILAPFGAVNVTGDSLEEIDTNPFGAFDEFSVLVLSGGYSQNPKIFVIDEDGAIRNNYVGAGYLGYPINDSHNYPMWFNADLPDTDPSGASMFATYVGDTLEMNPLANLYHNFWYIDDPRSNTFECTEATFTFGFDCEHLNSYDISKGIDINGNIARIESVKFNYSTREVEVTAVY